MSLLQAKKGSMILAGTLIKKSRMSSRFIFSLAARAPDYTDP